MAHGCGSRKGAIEAFYQFYIFVLFITARFLLACQCIQGASNLDEFVSGGGHLMITA